jgi:hypothetical protein
MVSQASKSPADQSRSVSKHIDPPAHFHGRIQPLDLFADRLARRAMIGGIPLAELNALELDFLFAIDFDLALPTDLYARRARALLPSIPEHQMKAAWRPPDQLRMAACHEPSPAAEDPPRPRAACRRSTAAPSVECADSDDSDWPSRPRAHTAAAAAGSLGAAASPPPGGPSSPDGGLPSGCARPACRRPAWLAGSGPDIESH